MTTMIVVPAVLDVVVVAAAAVEKRVLTVVGLGLGVLSVGGVGVEA